MHVLETQIIKLGQYNWHMITTLADIEGVTIIQNTHINIHNNIMRNITITTVDNEFGHTQAEIMSFFN